MCITAEALALFLNILAMDNITTEPGRVVIHAEASDAHWVAVEDEWCTMAPQLESMARMQRVRAE